MLDAVEDVLDSIEFAAEDVDGVSLVLVSSVLVEVVPLESVVCIVDTEPVSADVTVELCRDPELELASDEGDTDSVALLDSVVVSEVVETLSLLWVVEDIDVSEVVPELELDCTEVDCTEVIDELSVSLTLVDEIDERAVVLLCDQEEEDVLCTLLVAVPTEDDCTEPVELLCVADVVGAVNESVDDVPVRSVVDEAPEPVRDPEELVALAENDAEDESWVCIEVMLLVSPELAAVADVTPPEMLLLCVKSCVDDVVGFCVGNEAELDSELLVGFETDDVLPTTEMVSEEVCCVPLLLCDGTEEELIELLPNVADETVL